MNHLEHALLEQSAGYLWVLAALFLPAPAILRKLRDDDGEEQSLIFEEGTAPPFEILNLSNH